MTETSPLQNDIITRENAGSSLKENIELIYDMSADVRKRLSLMNEELNDEIVRQEIQKYILKDDRTKEMPLFRKKDIIEGVFSSLRRDLDFLEKYLKDPDISEIMVNGRENIFIEKKGKIERFPVYEFKVTGFDGKIRIKLESTGNSLINTARLELKGGDNLDTGEL